MERKMKLVTCVLVTMLLLAILPSANLEAGSCLVGLAKCTFGAGVIGFMTKMASGGIKLAYCIIGYHWCKKYAEI